MAVTGISVERRGTDCAVPRETNNYGSLCVCAVRSVRFWGMVLPACASGRFTPTAGVRAFPARLSRLIRINFPAFDGGEL